MKISFDIIKNILKEKKYIATDDVVWNVIKGIKKMKEGKQKGQDLYSICLEGPPGAGKTFYAETYKKVLEEVFNEEVVFLQYQCDSTTGKSELFEEIRVAAAITGNAEEVIIAGMLVEAIDAVNEGKKVVLLLDEFEKSRKETDSFLYQFLQNGMLKTTQRGIVKIKPEYKKNLQVILCKNDERELADPLLRRNHIIRLDVMTPQNFVETVNMNLSEYDIDIKNIVTLLYSKMYKVRDNFAKFPSCSEGMLAVQDACDLLEENAPAEVIYADILSNMLKHPDDIKTFNMIMSNDNEIGEFVKKVLKSRSENNFSARDKVYQEFFADEIQRLSGMKKLFHDKEESLKRRIQKLNAEIDRLRNSGRVKKTNKKAQSKKEDIKVPIFESDIYIDGETIYMPTNIVNNNCSIFDDSDEWYEIMEIRAEDVGWGTIEDIVKGGVPKLIEETLVYTGLSREEEGRKHTPIDKILNKKNEIAANFLKNQICIDGIILEKGLFFDNKINIGEIVARKVKKDDKEIYIIYSSKKILTSSVLLDFRNWMADWNLFFNVDKKPKNIGLLGLNRIFRIKGIPYSCDANFLMFHKDIMKEKRENSKYSFKNLKEIATGLFQIEEYRSDDLLFKLNNWDTVDGSHLSVEDERLFADLYEELLFEKEKVYKLEKEEGEIR